jgi:hypothetical protein
MGEGVGPNPRILTYSRFYRIESWLTVDSIELNLGLTAGPDCDCE